MHRAGWVRLPAAVLAGLVLAVGSGCSRGVGQRSPSSASAPSAPSGRCPAKPLRLPADAVARAAEQALKEAAVLYQGLDTRGVTVQAADRSSFAGPRGEQVRRACGALAARRTVVVQLFFPRMLPSASLSQGVVFVARFPEGYRVWEVVH